MAAKEQFMGRNHAKIYSMFRRDTPPFLTKRIIEHLKECYDGPLDLALDVGCGSGQGSVALSPFFKKVYGVDVSEAQIDEAKQTRNLPNVTYAVSSAEHLAFEDESVQLITAAAALHWFELDTFFPEARRILCKNGILAVYCYYSMKPVLSDAEASKEIDALYNEYYAQTEKYNAIQAKIAYNLYKDIEFPFEEVQRFYDIQDIFEATVDDMVGYITTFSGFQNWLAENEQEATEYISRYDERLRQLISKCGIDTNKTMQVYRSYVLIICRKK